MKEINKKNKASFLKKLFIKICRMVGYEIIDQSLLFIPTQNKSLNDNLNIQGKKSITIPLGVVNVSRKVRALTIIFRSCMSVNMLTQNKKRLFEKDKSEYTLRSLNSILKSAELAKNELPKINFNIIIIDHNSEEENLKRLKKLLVKFDFKNTIINLNVNEFINNINKTNAQNEKVSKNQISNMSNINKSLNIAKNECDDLIYFVEDDYIHDKTTIKEMIFTYERISSITMKELILCPIDYPYLYTKLEYTKLFLGASRHWRVIQETLCTFLTSKEIVVKYWEQYVSMCKFEHYPFESPLHQIYKNEYCLSPIPSLAVHFTNVNSIYGISPYLNWNKLWKDNAD